MGEMYARICTWENLRLAHHKAARGKRGKRPAAAFEYNLAESRVLVREPGEYGIGPAPGHSSLSRATPTVNLPESTQLSGS
jgi:hypothetical protein